MQSCCCETVFWVLKCAFRLPKLPNQTDSNSSFSNRLNSKDKVIIYQIWKRKSCDIHLEPCTITTKILNPVMFVALDIPGSFVFWCHLWVSSWLPQLLSLHSQPSYQQQEWCIAEWKEIHVAQAAGTWSLKFQPGWKLLQHTSLEGHV